MRISKNKKAVIFTVVLGIGLLAVSKQNNDMPEDNSLSSGNSVIWGNMVKIDNYASIEGHLKNEKYTFWEEISILQDEEEYPQGLCMTERFVLVSSYSGVPGRLGMIKVFDKLSGEYLLSLGMDENSHLGGIAYDGKYIWVCNSSKISLEKISYSFLLHMIEENRGQMIDIRNLVEPYHLKNIPSTVTFYDDSLWVATHSIWTNGMMIRYRYEEHANRIRSQESFTVPSKVQGIAFSEEGNVFLSTSYGRTKSSLIKKYESVNSMSENVKSIIKEIELPPCSEGIVYEDKMLYILFESAGKKYLEGTDGKGRSSAPLDRILRIQI